MNGSKSVLNQQNTREGGKLQHTCHLGWSLQCTGKLFAAFRGIRDTKISLLVWNASWNSFVECLFVESGTNDVICQFCTVKGMVVESEILKALCCALSK